MSPRSEPGRVEAGGGLFLAFEGIEGCGKSTQIAELARHLAQRGRTCRVTREPGGTPLGEALRRILLDPESAGIDGLTELFLLEASRRAHTREVIEPALARGEVVIADRFADSSVAYQGGGRGLGVELVERLNAVATGGLMPRLTFLLDLAPEEGLARVARRDRRGDRMEQEAIEFHRRVAEGYRALAARRGAAYCVLDAARPPEDLAREIRESVSPLLAGQPCPPA